MPAQPLFLRLVQATQQFQKILVLFKNPVKPTQALYGIPDYGVWISYSDFFLSLNTLVKA